MIWFLRRRQASVSRVGRGCQLEGALQADGQLYIEGSVRGLVSANGDIEISETGFVEGREIRGHNILVQGVVKAHVYAEGRLTLGSTARIEGDVTAGMIDVSPGAYCTGFLATCDSRTPFYGASNGSTAPGQDEGVSLGRVSPEQVKPEQVAPEQAVPDLRVVPISKKY